MKMSDKWWNWSSQITLVRLNLSSYNLELERGYYNKEKSHFLSHISHYHITSVSLTIPS